MVIPLSTMLPDIVFSFRRQNGLDNCVKASFQISITAGSSLRRENHRGIMYLLSSITDSTTSCSPSRSSRRFLLRSVAARSLSLNSRASWRPPPTVINICRQLPNGLPLCRNAALSRHVVWRIDRRASVVVSLTALFIVNNFCRTIGCPNRLSNNVHVSRHPSRSIKAKERNTKVRNSDLINFLSSFFHLLDAPFMRKQGRDSPRKRRAESERRFSSPCSHSERSIIPRRTAVWRCGGVGGPMSR